MERRCLKWAYMTCLGTSNISYDQKKGWESNCQFDSWPLKVNNRPNFPYVQVACYILLESSQPRLQLCLKPHLNWRFAQKVMGFQSCESSNLGNFRIPTWSLGTKWHLGDGPMVRHKEHYKGEGGVFPQVQAVVSLVSLCLPVVSPCTKSAPIMH